jgi:hypothetical protein
MEGIDIYIYRERRDTEIHIWRVAEEAAGMH